MSRTSPRIGSSLKPMEIVGLPLHPLVVHAAVVLIPTTAALGILFAVLPRWRWLTRWPVAAMAVLSVGIAFIATRSGKALLEARPALKEVVETHEERGELLLLLTIGLAVVVLVSAFLLPGPTALASGKGERASRAAVADKVLPVLLVVAALVVLAQAVLTGDSGSRAVWGS